MRRRHGPSDEHVGFRQSRRPSQLCGRRARIGVVAGGGHKHVLALEQSLGARLLNRNTRRLSLTEVGAVAHERFARILEEIDEVERNAGALQTNPRGVLRITAPVSFGVPHLAPATVDYMARYPDVSIDMVLNDRTVDLIEDGNTRKRPNAMLDGASETGFIRRSNRWRRFSSIRGKSVIANSRRRLAIDGQIFQNAYLARLNPDSEIYLIPKIGGG